MQTNFTAAQLVNSNIREAEKILRMCLAVERLDHAPSRGDVHHPVDDKRRRFLAAVGVEVGVPGEAELLHMRLSENDSPLLALST